MLVVVTLANFNAGLLDTSRIGAYWLIRSSFDCFIATLQQSILNFWSTSIHIMCSWVLRFAKSAQLRAHKSFMDYNYVYALRLVLVRPLWVGSGCVCELMDWTAMGSVKKMGPCPSLGRTELKFELMWHWILIMFLAPVAPAQRIIMFKRWFLYTDCHRGLGHRPTSNISFLPARRYASAGVCDSDVSVCPSVRLSAARRYCA